MVLSRRTFLYGIGAMFMSRSGVSAQSRIVELGPARADPPIELVSMGGKSGPTFLSLHGNERTAIEVMMDLLPHRGGRLVMLSQRGMREIAFSLRGKRYSIDPNRIFDPDGISTHLRGGDDPSAKEVVLSVASQVLEAIRFHSDQKPLIAIHNNTDGGGLSITSYAKSKPFRAGVAKLHIAPGRDPDDFFLVTKAAHFKHLKEHGWNVVLENPRTVAQDGSMSVLCGRRNKPYVNVESQHGSRARQKLMLLTAYELS